MSWLDGEYERIPRPFFLSEPASPTGWRVLSLCHYPSLRPSRCPCPWIDPNTSVGGSRDHCFCCCPHWLALHMFVSERHGCYGYCSRQELAVFLGREDRSGDRYRTNAASYDVPRTVLPTFCSSQRPWTTGRHVSWWNCFVICHCRCSLCGG